MTTSQILISAGEASGDMYAARLAAALRQRADVHLFGLGGTRMREAAVELLEDCAAISMVGITEVVRRAPAALRINRRLVEEARRRKPELAILVDFPDFNLRLARRIKPLGVRIIYFISPQVWAWRRGRIHLIKQLVERVICIFPFEEKFYRDAGVPVDFVGHPLVDAVRPGLSRQQFAAQHGLDASRPIVALLPGSREGEIAHNLPPMLEAAQLLKPAGVDQFVLALPPGVSACDVSGRVRWEPSVRMVQGATYDALGTANAAMVSSGTATVEAALLGTPMVVVYRVSRTSAFILRRMVRTPFYSMVNLIAGHRVVPELIQEEFTPARVAEEIRRLLESPETRDEMQRGLRVVRERLGPAGAIERSAGIIAGMLA
jgi:lipid-A-disaccharide synthase